MKNPVLIGAVAVLVSVASCCAGDGNKDAGFSSVPLSDTPSPYAKRHGMVGRALAYLKDSQNDDGSWGSGPDQCKSTALAIIAFTRHMKMGESGSKYESAITNACAWLRQARTETDEDRLAVVIAIAGLYAHEHSSRIPRKSSGVADLNKMNALLADIKNPKDNAWFDFLAISKQPEGVTRPAWSVSNKALYEQRKAKNGTVDLKSQDDYLNLYLETVAKWTEDKTRARQAKIITEQLSAKQGASGAFQTDNENDAPIATALSAMCLSLDFVTAHRFFSGIQASDE